MDSVHSGDVVPWEMTDLSIDIPYVCIETYIYIPKLSHNQHSFN